MDRTLIESQQLDLLFEQMLASRMQQGNPGTVVAAASAVGGASRGVEAENGAALVGVEEGATLLPQLQYADLCEDFCVEADQMWPGMCCVEPLFWA
jgi:hypothetical protein